MNEKTLACVSDINAIEIFTVKGIDPLIQAVRDEVSGFVPDLETAKGRSEIASLAFKVSRSKTALDSAGKELVAGKKAEIKIVDNARKKMRDELDDLRDEVRLPLTEWEEAEAKRKAEEARIEAERISGIKAKLEELAGLDNVNFRNGADFLVGRLAKVNEFEVTEELFQEYFQEATRTKEKVISTVEAAISDRAGYDKEQAELEEKRKANEEAERVQREAQEKLDREREEFDLKKATDEQKRVTEQIRIDNIKTSINRIHAFRGVDPGANSEWLKERLESAKAIDTNEDFYQEFHQDAVAAKELAVSTLEKTLESRLQHEKELAEIEEAKEKNAAKEREAEEEAARATEQARLDALKPDLEKLQQWSDTYLVAAIDNLPELEDAGLADKVDETRELLQYIKGVALAAGVEGGEK